jgi:hypothetical protein
MSVVMEKEIKRWTLPSVAATLHQCWAPAPGGVWADRDGWATTAAAALEQVLNQPTGALETCPGTVPAACETQQHAIRVIGNWIPFYHHPRPHQRLGIPPLPIWGLWQPDLRRNRRIIAPNYLRIQK